MIRELEETISLFPHLDGFKVRDAVLSSVEEYIRATYPSYKVTTRTEQEKGVDWHHIESRQGLLRGFTLSVGVTGDGLQLKIKSTRASHLSFVLMLVLGFGGVILGALGLTVNAAEEGLYGPGTFFFGGLLGMLGGGLLWMAIISTIWWFLPATAKREIDQAVTEHFEMTTGAIRDIVTRYAPS